MNNLKKEILALTQEPISRQKLLWELEYPEKEVEHALREMLYTDKLQTTPEWLYEVK